MKSPAPSALFANVLNQRREMIKNRSLEPARQPRDFDVLHSFDFLPMLHDKRSRLPAEKESLAAVDRVRIDDDRLAFDVTCQRAKPRIIKAPQCDPPFEQR